jgi:predicted DNA-binding transcriptional regulator AlpA
MMQVIKGLLLKIVDDSHAGNSEMSKNELYEVVDLLKRYNFRDKYISKYQAYTYLNIRRAKFDNLVREGVLPRGKKIEGFKELQWSLKEIKEYGKKVATNNL